MIAPRLVVAALALLWAAACSTAPAEIAASPARETAAETSVKPGINQDFLDPQLEVSKFEQRFEGESREIFSQRARIAGLLQLQPGMAVADVGAGTGLFTWMFATAVGTTGKVIAVDIAPRFIEHIQQQATAKGVANVSAILCTERSVELPAASVDLVFTCDTYHHFEYPASTLASIHRALRPGGSLVVVDFIREEGISRPWILDHVRAGQAVVTQEIEAAGFRLERVEATPFLRENYMLRFRKQ
jgi:predicted methyltransferase